MSKFKKTNIIETDNNGFYALKSFLPEGSIVWCRTINKTVIVKLSEEIDLDFVINQLNSLHNVLNS